MHVINATSLARAHDAAIKYILQNGYELTTEEGDKTLETDTITIIIDNPLDGKLYSNLSPFKQSFLDAYANHLVHGSKESSFEYDYYTRLCEWKGIVNQIDYIVHKLQSEQTSRRAIAITWEPDVDTTRSDVPCLQLVQFAIRDDKLNMTVVFRSNDMLLACGANMYGLACLQKHVADRINDTSDTHVKIGNYQHISLIPHIYTTRDADLIEQYKKALM